MKSVNEDWLRMNLRVVSVSGDELECECPWCGKVKLWANPKRGQFICYYGCAQGSLISLVSKFNGVNRSQARDLLRAPPAGSAQDLCDQLHGITITEKEDERVFQALPEEYQPCFDGKHYRVPMYASTPPPEGRGLEDYVLARHGIGYAQEGRYRDRLVVPIHCKGEHTFVARLMGESKEYSWVSQDGDLVEPPKYLHPKGANVGRFLYWHDHTPQGVDIIMLEGVFDAIRLIDFGLHALANFGKQLTKRQLRLVKLLRPKSITFLYDHGATCEAATDAAKARRVLPCSCEVYLAKCTWKDPDRLGYERGERAVQDLLKDRTLVKDRTSALVEMMNSFV